MKKLLPLLLIACLLTACAPQNTVQNAAQTTHPDADSNSTQTEAQTPADTEQPEESGPAPVAPLPSTVTLSGAEDCTFFVSFEEDDFSTDAEGHTLLTVTVYDYERFAAADMAALQVGDTILLRGEAVTVTALEPLEGGTLLINGGVFEGGYEMGTDGDDAYREIRENDHREFYRLGEITLPLSADFVFTDNADLDNTGLTFDAAALAAGEVAYVYTFCPLNTTARISGGEIVALDRRYIP